MKLHVITEKVSIYKKEKRCKENDPCYRIQAWGPEDFPVKQEKNKNWAVIGNIIFLKIHFFIKSQKPVFLLQWSCVNSSTKTRLLMETNTSVVVPGENNSPYSSYLSQFFFFLVELKNLVFRVNIKIIFIRTKVNWDRSGNIWHFYRSVYLIQEYDLPLICSIFTVHFSTKF